MSFAFLGGLARAARQQAVPIAALPWRLSPLWAMVCRKRYCPRRCEREARGDCVRNGPATPPHPPGDPRLEWVLNSGARYWPQSARQRVASLEMPEVDWKPSRRCVLVRLPAWAEDIGVGDPPALLVDSASIVAGKG